jgi:hypothetical protein
MSLKITYWQKIIRARRIAKALKAGNTNILNCPQAGKFSNFFATMQDKILQGSLFYGLSRQELNQIIWIETFQKRIKSMLLP